MFTDLVIIAAHRMLGQLATGWCRPCHGLRQLVCPLVDLSGNRDESLLGGYGTFHVNQGSMKPISKRVCEVVLTRDSDV